jgi:Cys-tRNA(Pro) deacylase
VLPLVDTPVTAFLSRQQVPFRLLPHQRPAVSIEDAASQRGISPAQMVKSILLRDMDNNYVLACVPGDQQADPKKVRAFLGCRRMTCVALDDVPAITGYQIGTVAPILLATEMPVFFDHSIKKQSEVTISSGSNMAGIALKTEHLIALCRPQFAHITR